jgi:hypothetical protein
MNEYLISLIQKYKRKGILIDTNLTLLYVVGSVDMSFKRISMFSEEDFERVSKFIDYFDFKITTPHILTEASDFIDNRQEFQKLLELYIEISEERFLDSKRVCKEPNFKVFGLADTATLEIARDSYLVFTDDRPLFGYLTNLGIDAVNLDQVRLI